MALQILKFGGSSIASIELMRAAADIVINQRKHSKNVVVVVSAMGAQTDELLSLLRKACPHPTARELDVIAHTGELVSSSLFASVLQGKGVPARSISGSVAGIFTNNAHGNARINSINTKFLRKIIEQGEIPVVAGYQGVNQHGEVTTLGRGGSDTTAAALATELGAEECRIYTDVPGVFTADPRVCPDARLLDEIYFEEILELAALGAKVLHPRAIMYAGRHQLPLRVLSTFAPDAPGTLISFKLEKHMEKSTITGIAYNVEEAKVTLRGVPDQPGVAAQVFSSIANAGIEVDVIVQNTSSDKVTDISFTVHQDNLARALEQAQIVADQLNCETVDHNPDVAKVSMVGVGMRGHAGIASQMFTTLADAGINIQMISTSEIKISVIIDEERAMEAVRTLHERFAVETTEEISAASTRVTKVNTG